MKTLVFSRRNCIYSTVTRRQGLKTGTVSILRGNLSKSPKRPALPDAVKRGRAVPRHRPFVLLLFFTPPGALIRGFFNGEKPGAFPQEKTGAAHPRDSLGASRRRGSAQGAEFGFCGLGTGRFPTLGRNPPHRPSQARETRCFSAGKDGCCAPEGFSLTKPPAWSCTPGETGGAWVRAAGYKKAAAWVCLAAAC